MPSKLLLHEAQQLKDVSERLELLADQHDHSHVADAILSICGAVRTNATMIEVLVATKFDDARPV
jgi:hypothetical protein